MSSDPCRTLSKDLRNENGGDHYGFVAISRPGQIDDGCYRYGVSVEQFLSEPENFGGTWLIDGGWGGPPGPIRVDWLDSKYSESRWQCRGYSAECRDPFLPTPPVRPAPAERNRIPTRQAVQILSFPLGRIAALCNDGTIWVSDKEDGWHKLAPIPQEIES
jgi:hypothetical protein